MSKPVQSGFGIIELLIVLTVGAVVLAIAVPNFQNMIQNQRAVTLTNELVSSVNYARTEAIKRGVRVSICPAANDAATACSPNAQWTNGWIIFADVNNNGQLTDLNNRLRVKQAPAAGSAINMTTNRIAFDESGFVATGAGSIQLSATGCYGLNGRQVTLGNTGHLSVSSTHCH